MIIININSANDKIYHELEGSVFTLYHIFVGRQDCYKETEAYKHYKQHYEIGIKSDKDDSVMISFDYLTLELKSKWMKHEAVGVLDLGIYSPNECIELNKDQVERWLKKKIDNRKPVIEKLKQASKVVQDAKSDFK